MMTPLVADPVAAVEPPFLTDPSPNILFTGKGGVGKTTCACATALRLANAGRRVLLVSTDPASNLDQVLGVRLGIAPVEVPLTPGLLAMNLDPEQAAAAYREKIVAPVRGVLPEGLVRSMEEQLSGACVVEISAFDLFAGILAGEERPSGVEVVIFDTAPTGHTLRLLKLPAAWSGFLEQNTTGNTCLGPLQGLKEKEALYAKAVEILTDAEQAEVILVSRAQAASLREAERTRIELDELGISRSHLVINGVLNVGSDPVSRSWAERGAGAISGMPSNLAQLPRTVVGLRAATFQDPEGLRSLFDSDPGGTGSPVVVETQSAPSWDSLVDDLASQPRGMVMTMGKGGVGKTIIAARLAETLAARGLPVILATTDPAAHAAEARTEDSAIEVVRIDAAAETEAYRDEVLATAGADLDEDGRALLEEDLRSPCTEEVAVFRAFARIVEQGTDRLVVCDTAPTGHTLLLLDATQAYHRELGRQSVGGVPESVLQLLPRLRDPEFNRVFIVTLPESTPVHEAGALHEDLTRAGIEPHAWIINQSLAMTGTSDPLLLTKSVGEANWIEQVIAERPRAYLLPWREDWLY